LYVSHLVLHDFRSYADVEVVLDPGATAFIGSNGQGKTNLVEAIDYLSRLSSHRVATDAPLVRAGADQAVIRAAVVRDGRTAVLEVEINPGRANRARVNKSALPKTRDLVAMLLGHGARAWRASQPEVQLHLHVITPKGAHPIRLRLR
jgi:DNA replication and repair protein RecF